MQYKIPVQIENEDPIILSLSLRQIFIILAWIGIWYLMFNSLSQSIWTKLALIPAIIIAGLWGFIAIFKYSEMTFTKFVLSFIRFKVNLAERRWMKTVDSFSALDIGYIVVNNKKEEKVDFWDKMSKMKKMESELEKI